MLTFVNVCCGDRNEQRFCKKHLYLVIIDRFLPDIDADAKVAIITVILVADSFTFLHKAVIQNVKCHLPKAPVICYVFIFSA